MLSWNPNIVLLHQIYCSHKLFTSGYLSSTVLWATGTRLLVCAFVCFYLCVQLCVCVCFCVSVYNFYCLEWANFKTKVNQGFLCPSLSGYDFCAEGLICGENSECKNRNTKAECECKSGYASIHGDSTYCEGRTLLYPAQAGLVPVWLTHNIYLLARDVRIRMSCSVSAFNSLFSFKSVFMRFVIRFYHNESMTW